jgi:hypothetical protein
MSSPSFTVRLHGTWIPGAHVDMQRDLEQPITPQPTLVHKIMASRFRHFVDIFTARPRSRSRTLAERMAFWVLFLGSWIALGQAVLDISNDQDMRKGAVAWLSSHKSSLTRYLEPVSGLQVSNSVPSPARSIYSLPASMVHNSCWAAWVLEVSCSFS